MFVWKHCSDATKFQGWYLFSCEDHIFLFLWAHHQVTLGSPASADCTVSPSFVKEPIRHRNGKKIIIVIVIVNNQPWKKGTTVQGCWLEPTCCAEVSWMIVTQVFILRLTMTYMIIYFITPLIDFSYSPLLRYKKPSRVSEMGRSHKDERKSMVLLLSVVQDQKH